MDDMDNMDNSEGDVCDGAMARWRDIAGLHAAAVSGEHTDATLPILRWRGEERLRDRQYAALVFDLRDVTCLDADRAGPPTIGSEA